MRGQHFVVAGAAAFFLTSAGWAISYEPPEEVIPAGLSGDNAELVRTNCMGCHSLDYIATQPRKDAAFWKATVAKMVTVYGAPVTIEDGEKVVTVLAVYGKGQ
jgi:mono/diheme cytochrome c family protein